jgi:hypothetical protein
LTVDLPDGAATDAERPAGTETPPPRPLPGLLRLRPAVADGLAFTGLLAVLAALWSRGAAAWYWLDEGLSLGISSHSLGDIARVLHQDGSPPLYYWLLHVWTSALGTSETHTHALSLILALITVVAAWWVGSSLFGRRTAWFLVGLAALNPYLSAFANETRMYALLTLLATVSTGSFLHAFVFRRRRYLPVFTLSLALMLYTHNWGLLYAVGAGVAVLPCLACSDDRRRLLLDALVAFGAAGLLFLPWIPTLLFQIAHTGAPAAVKPKLVMVRDQLAGLVGGREPVIVLGLGAGAPLATRIRRPWSRTSLAVVATAIIPVVTVVLAWALSRRSSVWAFRYLGVVVPPMLMVAAFGMATGGRLALAAFVVLVFLTAPIDVRIPPYRKSNVKLVATGVSDLLRPSDLVISPDFGEVPLLSHYLPPGLRYATSEGLVADVGVSDQREATNRLRDSRFAQALPPLVDGLSAGGHVLLVCPPPASSPPEAEFIRLIFQRCDDVDALLRADSRLRLERSVDVAPLDVAITPVNGRVFTKGGP